MSVATLHVRNFPDQLYEALRARAERQGRSIGAEAIAIVAATLVARTDRERRVLQLIRTRRSRGRGGGLFTRFTTRARQVVVDAQNEARSLKHNYIGTEHLLLGLLLADEGIGRAILESLGVTHARVRDEVLRLIGEGEAAPVGQIPFTPRSKKALELALREALALKHDFIGTEHLLLGLASKDEQDSVAYRILDELGAPAERVCETVMAALSGLPGAVSVLPEQDPAEGEALAEPEWEYRAIALTGSEQDWTEQLNELAAAGWELFSLGANGYRAVFRRETAA